MFFIVIIFFCFRYAHLLNSIKYYKIVHLNIIFISHSLTNKTDRHDTTEILLKVALNTLTPTLDTRKVYQYTELVCLWLMSLLLVVFSLIFFQES